ncbi:MAG: shikimate dehydrogenase [Chrysiogenetes bacterium]|nr:shikimate dehydrogenase [Chrysiogenetes bacterium]
MTQPPLTAQTALYAVLGDPVEHSLSPVFQNAALEAGGVDARYVALRMSAEELPDFLKGIRHSNIKGFNATIPHKEALVKLCDKLSKEAQLIGAVNTVSIKAGKLHGDNTDGVGFLESLFEEAKFDPKGKKVCLLGAGGSARAIGYSLAKAGASQIVIANRTAPKARALADELGAKVKKTKFSASSHRSSELSRAVEGADLLVNATSVGLGGRGIISLPWGVLPKPALIADIVYEPRLTPLLTEAKRRKYKILGGLGMLVHQGALSYEIWTGTKPDVAKMRKAADKALRDREG